MAEKQKKTVQRHQSGRFLTISRPSIFKEAVGLGANLAFQQHRLALWNILRPWDGLKLQMPDCEI